MLRNLNKKRQTEREMTPAEIRKPTVSKETEYMPIVTGLMLDV